MDVSKINTFDRIDADLDDWEGELEQIRRLISDGEANPHDEGDSFREARKKIAGILDGIQQTREFISLKRGMAETTTADVESLFVDDKPAVPFDFPEGEYIE